MAKEQLYTRTEVAEMLGKTYDTIRRWERTGRINVASRGEKHQESQFSATEVRRLGKELGVDVGDSLKLVWTRDQSPSRFQELAALRREVEILRADLERERSLVDRLLKKGTT